MLTTLALTLAFDERVTYPHTGSNPLSAGGGGSCTYEYSSPHDGQPVVTSASCSITKTDLNTGTEPGTTERAYVRKLGGHDGCTNDDAGHILANRLGGKAVPTNLFPQSPHLNRGAWESLERDIAGCMSGDASSASLKWTFTYSSSSRQRPTTATYAVSYDKGCASASQSFSNACTSSEAVEQAAAATSVSMNISCIDDSAASSGCLLHSQDGAYALAADRTAVRLGKQLDVLHVRQPSVNGSYSTLAWCVSRRSHVTASGNLVLTVGATEGDGRVLQQNGAAALDCSNKGTVDLDPGDCTVIVHQSGASSQRLQLCFNQREA